MFFKYFVVGVFFLSHYINTLGAVEQDLLNNMNASKCCTAHTDCGIKAKNLLNNTLIALEKIKPDERRRFIVALKKLNRRIFDCSRKMFPWDAVEKITHSWFGPTMCLTTQEVCLQNYRYFYPLFCTVRLHLYKFDKQLDYFPILKLFYGLVYGFQMMNVVANTIEPLRCEGTRYEIQPKYFNMTQEIGSDLLMDEKRFCLSFNDVYFNLYGDKDDPEFKNCQRGSRHEEDLNLKIHLMDQYIQNCEHNLSIWLKNAGVN